MEPYKIKQVIICRKELNLNTGKWSSQVAHGSMAFLTKRFVQNVKFTPPIIDHGDSITYAISIKKVEEEWLDESFAKIVVWVQTAEELHTLHEKALEAGIEAHFITDSGHTYFKGVPTVTCLALGPDYAEKLDPITRDLPLL